MKKPLIRTRSGLIAALDIGSSKACCFIARENEFGEPRIVGIGQQANRGMKAGTVADMEAVEASVRKAVSAAEQMAGETIDRVVVNLSGGYPASSAVDVAVAINGHEVGDADLSLALSRGRASGENGEQRALIHSIPVAYSIDGSRGIRDPRGMFGEQLGVNIHLVTAAPGAVRNLTTCVERCHLEIAGFVVSPYAAGLSALVEDETDLGVTLIDMGGGTTTIAVFLDGKVIYTDIVPVGGQHITNDIARGLSTSLSNAERIKTLYGHAVVAQSDNREVIEVPQVGEEESGEPQQVPRSLLVGIIQPRLEETFELVRSHLEASGFDKVAGRRVVLTGGAAQLPGLRELGGLLLDRQIRIGRPLRVSGLAEATAGPAYATCAGLLIYGLAADSAPGLEALQEATPPGGLIGRFGHWFREHF